MRLDKLICDCGAASRKEAASAIRSGRVTVNGKIEKKPDAKVDPNLDRIVFAGTELNYRQFVYVMLNKPTGYVSATDDKSLPYVLELLSPEYKKRGLFPAGRLDRDTTGLLIMTDDGQLAHRLLTPKHHVTKVYRFGCEVPMEKGIEGIFAHGMTIDGGEVCKPAILVADPDRMGGTVTLTEGKYHQVKRMFEKVGNKIIRLERISFAGIPLDTNLARGEWRELTEAEEKQLLDAGNSQTPPEDKQA